MLDEPRRQVLVVAGQERHGNHHEDAAQGHLPKLPGAQHRTAPGPQRMHSEPACGQQRQ
jgi:hypothetical protein